MPRPEQWGAAQWHALHQLLAGYPEADAPQATQLALRQYVQSLTQLLPCETCRQHWSKLVDTVKTKNRAEALQWSIDAHNAVNRRLGKPVLSTPEALEAIARWGLPAPAPTPTPATLTATPTTTPTPPPPPPPPPTTQSTGVIIGLGVGIGILGVSLVVVAVLAALWHRPRAA